VWIYQAIGNPGSAGGGGTRRQSTNASGAGIWSTTLFAGLTRTNITLLTCKHPCGFVPDTPTSEMSPLPTLFLPLVRR
jgi:hypothetical protein